uniref:XA10 n=1 Tax=Oryza sativa subsp. indica TaxID=39946 RepID=W5QN15_ORYSI|nr:XA10 [Oryza sativa Indica Group]
MQLMLTFCTGPLLFAVLLLMVYLKQLAAAACVDVLIIYLCRFLLLRGIIFSGDGKLRFRVKVAIGFLYISLSAILFYLSAAVMALPPWGAVAMWGMALVATELGYSFLCPYSCRCIGEDDEEISPV